MLQVQHLKKKKKKEKKEEFHFWYKWMIYNQNDFPTDYDIHRTICKKIICLKVNKSGQIVEKSKHLEEKSTEGASHFYGY